MHIGQIGKATGLTPDAIRFYERRGLLPHPQRSEGGFRIYSEKDLSTLQFIRRAQGLGFSLRETHDLVSLRAERIRASPTTRNRLRRKLEQVRTKIIDARRLERELTRTWQKCAKK